MVSNQVLSKFCMARYDRVSNSKPKKERDTRSPTKKTNCVKCGKNQYRDCLTRMDNCFDCG